tara:strand:- start:651 stop:812 length:162 start_codon:yes stop_codon:yes gene_type:complete
MVKLFVPVVGHYQLTKSSIKKKSQTTKDIKQKDNFFQWEEKKKKRAEQNALKN